MKKHTLKHLLNESLTEDELQGNKGGNTTDNIPPVNRKLFKQSLQRFHEYSQLFNRDVQQYKQALEEIKYLVNAAESVTLEETQDWFDNVTVSRHVKQMKEAYKVFEKTLMESAQLSQRLNAAYEDIGKVLQNYYDV